MSIMLSETIPQGSEFCRQRPSFFTSLKRKADQKCGFNEFQKCFPNLCQSSSLNTPQTPSVTSPFQDYLNDSTCDVNVKCAKMQSPSMSTMKKLSNSASHPAISTINPSYRTVCSNEGSSPTAPISQIFDFLYLGSQEDAQNSTILKQHGITRVINLSDCPKSDLIPESAFYRIPIKDSYDAKINIHFNQAFEFIEETRRTNQRVLVHCLAGISRSPTLAISYIMKSKALTTDEAYRFVKSKRPSVSPNLNFMGQLFLYERHLREQNILPPAVRPRPTISNDYNPPCSKETIQLAAEPMPPSIINENLCKSASVDFSLLSSESTHENRKRIMDSPLSMPCRPRQLMKNCCVRKKLDDVPQLPSPSSEFSKLDISLSNPCFGNSQPTLPSNSNNIQPSIESTSQSTSMTSSTASTSNTSITNAENPVFGLISEGDKTHSLPTRIKSGKKPSASSDVFNLLLRRPAHCKMTSTARLRCKMGKCFAKRCSQKAFIIDESSRSTGVDSARLRQGRFSRMPTIEDIDDADSGKGSSISHSVSTEDGDSQLPTIELAKKSDDPERDSLSSASSLEIAVQ